MKLYHGTSSRFLESILASGILPRDNRRCSQFPEEDTRPDLVYLTKCFGPQYALNATRNTGEKWLIVEVEISIEETGQLLPDEGYRVFLAADHGVPPDRIRELKVENEYRRTLEEHREEWQQSLDTIGNVAHKSGIATDLITRYCVVSAGLRHDLVSIFVEADKRHPMPMEIALPYCSDLSAWLFGDLPRLPNPPFAIEPEIGDVLIRESNSRSGIIVEHRL